MLTLLLTLMLASCCPVYCMQTPTETWVEEHHRPYNGVSHYSVFYPATDPATVKTSIDVGMYTITRTLTRTKEGKIMEKFSGNIGLDHNCNDLLSAQKAAQLFTEFIQKYKLIERTPEEWFAQIK